MDHSHQVAEEVAEVAEVAVCIPGTPVLMGDVVGLVHCIVPLAHYLQLPYRLDRDHAACPDCWVQEH